MYPILTVWTCVVLSVHQAESRKYKTPERLITAVNAALPPSIQATLAKNPPNKNLLVTEPIAQSIANRLVKKKERETWDPNVHVEVHTVLAFTFVIFPPQTLTAKQVNGRNDANLTSAFFTHEKRVQMKRKLGEVTADRKVLEVGCGVRIVKPKLYFPFGDTTVHVCIVLFTTDELLPEIVKNIADLGPMLHEKTTLYAAEYSLREQYGKPVLYESHWSRRYPITGKYIEYELHYNVEGDPPSISRKGPPAYTANLRGVEWDKVLYGPPGVHLSYGIGTWKQNGEHNQHLCIVTHSHKLVNKHPELPIGRASQETVKVEMVHVDSGKPELTSPASSSLASVPSSSSEPLPATTKAPAVTTVTTRERITSPIAEEVEDITKGNKPLTSQILLNPETSREADLETLNTESSEGDDDDEDDDEIDARSQPSSLLGGGEPDDENGDGEELQHENEKEEQEQDETPAVDPNEDNEKEEGLPEEDRQESYSSTVNVPANKKKETESTKSAAPLTVEPVKNQIAGSNMEGKNKLNDTGEVEVRTDNWRPRSPSISARGKPLSTNGIRFEADVDIRKQETVSTASRGEPLLPGLPVTVATSCPDTPRRRPRPVAPPVGDKVALATNPDATVLDEKSNDRIKQNYTNLPENGEKPATMSPPEGASETFYPPKFVVNLAAPLLHGWSAMVTPSMAPGQRKDTRSRGIENKTDNTYITNGTKTEIK